MPGAALLHSAAGKNGLRRSSPPLHSSASPSSRKPDFIHDARRDSDARSRHHLSSLHHSAAPSRDQLVKVVVMTFRQF